MIFYLLLTLLAFQAARLLYRGQLVTTLGVNFSNGDYDSGDEAAGYVAALNAAKTFLEFGDGTSPITIPKIDVGSNGNGSWLRLYTSANAGVQLCWIHDLTMDGFYDSSGTVALFEAWTFPRSFDNANWAGFILPSGADSGGPWTAFDNTSIDAQDAGAMGTYDRSSNSEGRFFIAGSGLQDGDEIDVDIVAIGEFDDS